MTDPGTTELAIAAERSLLGGIMIMCGDWPPDLDLLSPAHFSDQHRSRVYESISELRAAGEPIDQVTVFAHLRDHRDPPPKGWGVYLAALVDSAPTAANVGHHAAIVTREARRRWYVEVMTEALKEASVPGADADAIATKAALTLGQIAEEREIVRPIRLREAMKTELEDLDERRRTGATVGIPSGFPDLDRLLCGLVPGNLIIVAGRPSMGKSSLVRSILLDVGRRGRSGLLFSFEMSSPEIAQASIAHESRVNLQRIRSAALSQSQYGAVIEAVGELHHNGLSIVDSAGMGIDEIRSLSRSFKARHGLDVMAVDYLQLATARAHSREQEIAAISRGLKAIGKELSIPVIALSQLNRGLESREDKRPRLSDLRESGAIEQDADEVIFLYRDEYYNRSTERPGIAEVAVAKNRNGPTGMVELRWFGQFTRFESLAH
jgi:replicative DNA helicase